MSTIALSDFDQLPIIQYNIATSTLRRKYLHRYRLKADHSPPGNLSEKQPVLRPDRGLWSPQSVK